AVEVAAATQFRGSEDHQQAFVLDALPWRMAFRAAYLLFATSAVAVPDVPASEWCAWVPPNALKYVSNCSNTTASLPEIKKGCADWCPWVPGPSWKEVPHCLTCNASSPQGAVAETEPRSGLKVKVAAPLWCRTIPPGSLQYVRGCGHSPAIASSSQGPCLSWCQWVPAPSWQYTGDCRGCGTPGVASGPAPAPPTHAPHAPVSAPNPNGKCDQWCAYVPSPSWQYTPDCHGCAMQGPGPGHGPAATPGDSTTHTSCASWCTWVPTPSWRATPECHGCSDGPRPVPTPAQTGNVSCMSWCQWVPTPSWNQTLNCRNCSSLSEPEGATETVGNETCLGWCQWVPKASRKYTPECRGCSGVPAGPKPVGPALANISCAKHCKWVPRASWQTTPDCGSCSGNVSSPLPAGPTAPMNESNATNTSCVDWCQWVPTASWNHSRGCQGCFGQELDGPFLPQSGSNGSCVGWCQWVPKASWQYTPDCGLCSGRVPSVKPEGTVTATPQNGTCVNWCRWVPHMSWHSTPDCLGCSGASELRPDGHLSPSPVAECASWCQYMPAASQQSTPQCRGCSQALLFTSSVRCRRIPKKLKMADSKVGWNDGLLIVSLMYMCVDIQYEWEGFSSCKRPIHKWLLLSYGLVVMSRVVHVSGALMSQSSQSESEFMLNLRQKSTVVRLLLSLMWLVILPAFTIWSVVGTVWVYEVMTCTPECLPGGAHFWFLIVWQALSYFWIIVHCGLGLVAWYLERRLRRAEGDLRQL
ncbi:SIS3, partial [Symbiodinium sp. CCMP2456]